MIKAAIVQNARFGVFALLIGLVLAALFLFHEVLLPFVLAAFLSYLLIPLIARLRRVRIRRRRMPRGAIILLLYAIFLGVMVVTGFWVVPRFTLEVNRLVKVLPGILQQVEQEWVEPLERRIDAWIADITPPPDEEVYPPGAPPGPGLANGATRPPPTEATPTQPWRELVDNYTYVVRRLDDSRFEVVPQRRSGSENPATERLQKNHRRFGAVFGDFRALLEENLIELLLMGRKYVGAVANSFFMTFLVLMLAAFIMIDPGRIERFIRSFFPRRYHGLYRVLARRLDHGLTGVVRGQIIICLINGALTGIGIAIIGVPFVITLSLIATVFSLIPIFGVLISSIPILIIALTNSLMTAVLALLWILVIHFIEGNFLNPKILGDSARIHPALIVFALLVGQHMAGVVGALLAVPMFSLLQTSFLFLKAMAENVEPAP